MSLIPDLNDTPELNGSPCLEGDIEDDVVVAAEILNIPKEEDEDDSDDRSKDDNDDRSRNEEIGIRKSFGGMPDPLPCPPIVIKPRKYMSYQPTSHVKHLQTFETKEALKLAIWLKCDYEIFQVKVKGSSRKKVRSSLLR